MDVTPERILAIDADHDVVRGIVMHGGTRAQAGGYAQLKFVAADGPVAVAARIAQALDGTSSLPTVVTYDDDDDGEFSEQIADAIRALGFASVVTVPRADAERRSNPDGGEPESLIDCDIASGLLSSHDSLTLGQLAPVVGAGLGLLGLGAPDLEPVVTWHADEDTEMHTVAAGSNPFEEPVVEASTATDSPAESATSIDDDLTMTATAAAALLGASATASTLTGDDIAEPELDDVTMAASAMPDIASGDLDETVPPLPVDLDETVPPLPVDLDETVPPLPAVAATAAAAVPAAAAAAQPTLTTPAPAPEPAANPIAPITSTSKSRVPLLIGAVVLLGLLGLVVSQCGGDEIAIEPATATVAAAPTIEATAAPEVAVVATPETATEPTATEPTAEPTATEPTVEPTAEPEPSPEPEPTPEPAPTADPLAGLPPLSSLPERGAVFRPPILYLEGPVQTQAEADELYQRAIAVVGPDNVVNEYVVRPDAPASLDGNVRVEQAVLFQTGSSVISEEFIPTLELGVAVLTLNPSVTMVVEGHTDAIGGDAANQRLSEQRAQAVANYLASRGIDPERLQPVGFGESAPIADNDTEAGRQLNRRIEVNLLDLLAG